MVPPDGRVNAWQCWVAGGQWRDCLPGDHKWVWAFYRSSERRLPGVLVIGSDARLRPIAESFSARAVIEPDTPEARRCAFQRRSVLPLLKAWGQAHWRGRQKTTGQPAGMASGRRAWHRHRLRLFIIYASSSSSSASPTLSFYADMGRCSSLLVSGHIQGGRAMRLNDLGEGTDR